MLTTRRRFLQTAAGGSALVSLSPLVPNFLLEASAAQGKRDGDNVLVVLQLSGGNDGLNTIVPFADDEYYRNRYTLGVGRGQVLKIDDHVGFHPAMTGCAELLEAGQFSVIQGVGYPNPNRSHFESMDIWHTCRRGERREPLGWLGRYLDTAAARAGGDAPGLHFGAEKQPLALAAAVAHSPSVQSIDRFRLDDRGNRQVRDAIEHAADAKRDNADDLLRFLQASTTTALASSQRVQEAIGSYQTPIDYPGTALAQKLRTVAQLIDAGMTTRIYYVSLDGFDTHSNQADAHTGLLSELSGAVAAFVKDLAHQGHAERVLVMTFSEFGRRVKENASQGTDHGAAAPMFLAGGRVRAGLVGDHPSLNDLEDGDLKFHTDFRQVYAALLHDWLGFSATAPILGDEFQPASVVG
jgi:uncharacterized protein (DUF1501 family)